MSRKKMSTRQPAATLRDGFTMKIKLMALLSFAILLAPAAWADTLTGSASAGWQPFPAPSEHGPAYFENRSYDGSQKNVAYLMTNSGGFTGSTLGPGPQPYWGNSNGSA